MKFFTLFIASMICLSPMAQDLCGTDELHSYKMNTDLEYRQSYLHTQEQIQQIIEEGLAARSDEDEPYIIPVVVHVIHLGEAIGTGSNIPDAQIMAALNGLNERYANLIGNGLDIQMSFCLAKRDPQGCPTTGILRVNGAGLTNYQSGGVTRGGKSECTNAASDESVKNLSKWPVTQYYNIWVVHKICGGWAGYAYYPWGGAYDGAIMHRNYMTYNSITLAHEVGHAFNLPHTFDGDNNNANCPLDDNCATQGDRVCDTPPHKVNDCGATNPCTTEGVWDNSRRNYMSYCSTRNRFTQGQKERMHAAVQVWPRSSLLTSNACLPSTFNTSITKTNVSCHDMCDGFISVEPYCEGDYSFLWSTGETGASISPLCPGAYSVTISDALSATSAIFEFEIEDAPVIDTTMMVSINGALAFCQGDSVTLTSNNTGSYQWSNGDTNSSIVVTESGSYSLTLTSEQNCINTSTVIDVEVYPTPVVTLSLPDVVSDMDIPFVLNTGSPAGGEYSGVGISGGIFYPAFAGVGTHEIFYSYTDENGCFGEASETIVVEPFVDIKEIESDKLVRIYPNPSSGTFQMEITENGKAIVTCYDGLGKIIFAKIYTSHSNRNRYTIEMPAAAAGIYYLCVSVGEKTLVKTLLVQKQE